MPKDTKAIGDPVETVKLLFESGVRDVEGMHTRSGLPRKAIHRYAGLAGVELRRKARRKLRRNHRIDGKLRMYKFLRPEDLAASALARAGGYSSHSGLYEYLNRTGQYERWQERRAYLERKMGEERRSFLDVLEGGAQQLLEGADEALMLALGYDNGRMRGNHPGNVPTENVERLLRVHQEAELAGERLSLEELAERSGINHATTTGRILRALGKEPMFGARNDVRKVPAEKKEAMRRAYGLDYMTCTDFAYYLDVKKHNVASEFRRISKETGRKRKTPQHIAVFGTGSEDILDYRTASEIYRAQDAGLSREEIAAYVEKSEDAVSYSLKFRRRGERIGAKIMTALRRLRPDSAHTNPYLGS